MYTHFIQGQGTCYKGYRTVIFLRMHNFIPMHETNKVNDIFKYTKFRNRFVELPHSRIVISIRIRSNKYKFPIPISVLSKVYIYTTVYVRFSFALSHEDLTVLCTGIPVFRSMQNMISTWQRFALGFVAVCWSLNILAASLNSLTSQNGNLNGFWSYLNNLKFINFTFSFLAYCFRPDVSALSTFCCHISLPIRIFLLEGIRKHFT